MRGRPAIEGLTPAAARAVWRPREAGGGSVSGGKRLAAPQFAVEDGGSGKLPERATGGVLDGAGGRPGLLFLWMWAHAVGVARARTATAHPRRSAEPALSSKRQREHHSNTARKKVENVRDSAGGQGCYHSVECGRVCWHVGLDGTACATPCPSPLNNGSCADAGGDTAGRGEGRGQEPCAR